MSDDNKGGSDLDIFEGLGKKTAERAPAAPPPPPGSGSNMPSTRNLQQADTMKRTLIGVPGPANPMAGASSSDQTIPAAPATSPGGPPTMPAGSGSAPPASGHMRASGPPSVPAPTASKPPPPPGRASLPNLPAVQPASQPPTSAAQPASGTMKAAPSTRPAIRQSAPPATPAMQPAAAKVNGGKLDMDWDDEDEATHVFDKESKDNQKAAEPAAAAPAPTPAAGEPAREPDRASMDHIMSQPPRTSQPPAPPPVSQPPHTLQGTFGNLGQPRPNGSAPPPAAQQFKSGPPPSQSLRSAPPPPPASVQRPPTTQSQSTHPLPPPPPPGQTTTAPMHMPVRPPQSVPPHMQQQQHQHQQHQQHQQQHVPSAPPQQHVASAPPVQMPPVSRAMEPTAIVPRQSSKAPLVVALLVIVAMVAGAAVFFLMPRTGTLVVNVEDSKGAAVNRLEILVDGTKRCDSAPCILKEMSAGVHEVKIVAPGFEPPAPRAVTVEGRRDVATDFKLVASKNAGGTGFKVAGNQSGVKLYVDGKEIGPLPQELRDLEAGEHKLRFAGSDRYAPTEKTVTVAKDEIVDLGNVALKVVKGKATIQLGTPGAKVFLVQGTTRKEVPQSPMAIEFDPNEKWELQATKEGYEELKQPISFDDGQAEKTFNVVLTPKGQAPSAAAAPAWHAPAQPVAHNNAAPPPPPPAAAAKPEPAAKAEPAAKKDPPPPAAAGGEAFLNINSLPASTVVLDGKPLGATPKLHVQVTPGTHTILFVNAEQSLKKSITVNVAAGETKPAFAKLRD